MYTCFETMINSDLEQPPQYIDVTRLFIHLSEDACFLPFLYTVTQFFKC